MKFLDKQHTESGDNTSTWSVLLFLVPHITPGFQCMDCLQRLFMLFLWPAGWPNHSRNIWCGTRNTLLSGFYICHAIVSLDVGFIVCLTLVSSSHANYPSPHSSKASFECPKCFQEQYPHHFQLQDSRFWWFGRHLILDFVLHGGPLQIKLLPQQIFPTIQMQPHCHVETSTRMLWRSLQHLKCILPLTCACLECGILSV